MEPVRNLVAIGNAPWAPCSHTKLWSKTEVKPFSPPTVSVGGLMLSPPKCISHILYFPRFAEVEREKGERGKRKRVKQCRNPFPPQNPIKEHEERIIPSHSINIIVYVSNREINYPTIIYDIFNHPVPAEPRSRFKNRDFHDFLFGLH